MRTLTHLLSRLALVVACLSLVAPLQGAVVDSYGCGDSFAAGVTAGLAASWPAAEAIALGARCGAACAGVFGPYPAG